MRNASGHQCLWPSRALINGVPGYSTLLIISSDDGMNIFKLSHPQDLGGR